MNSESNYFFKRLFLCLTFTFIYTVNHFLKKKIKDRFVFILFFVLFHLIFADRLEERASSDKNVDPLSAPHNQPPEDPFGSVPFIFHSGKLHM